MTASEQSFDRIYQQFGGLVKRMLSSRVYDPDLRQQVEQQIWANVWQVVCVRPDDQLGGGFVAELVKRAVWRHLKRHEVRTRDLTSLESLEEAGGQPKAVCDVDEHAYVRDAIENLPQEYRTLLYDVFYAGRSTEEIGKSAGLTRAAISLRLQEAYDLLRASLNVQAEVQQRRLPTRAFRDPVFTTWSYLRLVRQHEIESAGRSQGTVVRERLNRGPLAYRHAPIDPHFLAVRSVEWREFAPGLQEIPPPPQHVPTRRPIGVKKAPRRRKIGASTHTAA